MDRVFVCLHFVSLSLMHSMCVEYKWLVKLHNYQRETCYWVRKVVESGRLRDRDEGLIQMQPVLCEFTLFSTLGLRAGVLLLPRNKNKNYLRTHTHMSQSLFCIVLLMCGSFFNKLFIYSGMNDTWEKDVILRTSKTHTHICE